MIPNAERRPDPYMLAKRIEEWDRICLESASGDMLDTMELTQDEYALIIHALRFLADRA